MPEDAISFYLFFTPIQFGAEEILMDIKSAIWEKKELACQLSAQVNREIIFLEMRKESGGE